MNLVVAGRACLVVGGGAVAARKVAGLVAAGAVVRGVALAVGPEARALGVPFEERAYRTGDGADCWLIVTATGDPAVNARVAADADAAGVWVNAADDPASCSFTLPAVVRRGPITVAVATDGHSPALARFLAGHVADEMGPEWTILAELLAAARARIKDGGGSTEAADWRAIVSWDMVELLRNDRIDLAKERIEAWLSAC